jgi:hypothetical protein
VHQPMQKLGFLPPLKKLKYKNKKEILMPPVEES